MLLKDKTKKQLNQGWGGVSIQQMSHFIHQYYPLSEKSSIKWIKGVTNLGAVSLFVKAAA